MNALRAMAWLDRTLPLAAHFPPGEIFREDRLPVPPEALREVLLNAVIHRDYTAPGSYVAIAVFDDRIEVRSVGGLPGEITAESLTRTHKSVLRNPLIAEAFHRTGAVEVCGARHQSRPLKIRPPRKSPRKLPRKSPRKWWSCSRQPRKPLTRDDLQKVVGLRHREHFRKAYLEPSLTVF